MREIHTRTNACVALLLLLSLLWSPVRVTAQGATNPDPEQVENAVEESQEAAEALRAVMETPDKGIPVDLLSRAEAVAVFANVVKAAVLIGGRGGDGAISRRTESGWSVPAFFKLGGASAGAQIGGSRSDIVLLFMDQASLDALLDDRLELGADVEAVAGPVGRRVSASTTSTLDKGVLVYRRSQGLFAGASVSGAVVTPDNELNRGVFGADARAILTGPEVASPPEGTRAFSEALAELATTSTQE
jgi:lipid-binding SYLF domain-containing protein